MKKTLAAALISAVLATFITVAGFASASIGTEKAAAAVVCAAEESAASDDAGEDDCKASDDAGFDYTVGSLGEDEKTRPSYTSENAVAAEKRYKTPEYPDGSAQVFLSVNDVPTPHGNAAKVGDTVYLPLFEFCGLFLDTEATETAEDGTVTAVGGDGWEIRAAEGERYITSGERVVWCGDEATVQNMGGIICVPAEPLCHLLGIEFVETDNVMYITGDASVKSADEFYDSDSLYWLSHIISAESRGEPIEGQIAVGSVVLNRLRTFDYLTTVYEVIFDRRFGIQFSPAYSGSVYAEPADSAVFAAKVCLEGYSVSDDIMYFINSSYTPSEWWSSSCKFVLNIGHHDFYS